jgi:plastocyanin
MRISILATMATLLMLTVLTGTGHAQRVHEITLETNANQDVYRFSPANVRARPGDVLLFRTVSGSPHTLGTGARSTQRSHEPPVGRLERPTAQPQRSGVQDCCAGDRSWTLSVLLPATSRV